MSGGVRAPLMPTEVELIDLKRLGTAALIEGTQTDYALLACEVVDAAEIYARAVGRSDIAREPNLVAGLRAGNTLVGLLYGSLRECPDCDNGTVQCNLGHDHDCPECDGDTIAECADDVLDRLVIDDPLDDDRAVDMQGGPLSIDTIRQLHRCSGRPLLTPARAGEILMRWQSHRADMTKAAA